MPSDSWCIQHKLIDNLDLFLPHTLFCLTLGYINTAILFYSAPTTAAPAAPAASAAAADKKKEEPAPKEEEKEEVVEFDLFD